MSLPMPSDKSMEILKSGVAIPASPLALEEDGRFAPARQKALFAYYIAAGAGGIAVGVHTTQFEIREPGIDLFRPLLEMAAKEISVLSRKHDRHVLRIAGVCGKTAQAVAEGSLAASLGYDAGLLSLGALKDESEEEILTHCRAVSRVIPLVGFYLQPAVGGRILPYSFWKRFCMIENVAAIKIAPFNRYQTLDVIRAVAEAGREDDIALYTGNDDNIIIDLLTPYRIRTVRGEKVIRIRGGLLGQWSIWTKMAVSLLEEIHRIVESGEPVPPEMLSRNAAYTDANAAVFDAAHQFAGCIPGINEVLRRQGLLRSARCLDPRLTLSPGQAEEIDRVCRDYPFLCDDEFVRAHLAEWLGGE
ncbi:MAG: dihydrodipicolinate synthase family protein [Candidatus Sumerlaeota bacterium]|nr:dihydrodipicolinate synthase family protein [Candidatus Sumerlaeota bacterium]